MTKSVRAARVLSWGFLLPFALQISVPQNFKFQKGQAVYVVAVRGGPFLACFANRQAPRYPNNFYAPELLPSTGELAIDAVPDADLKNRIEKEFQKEKYFKLVDSVENADFVFFAAASRVARIDAENPGNRASILADETARQPKPGSIKPVVPAGEPATSGVFFGGDWPDEQPDAIAFVAASAVPSGLYKKYQADAASIFQAGAWKGIDTALSYPSTKLSASPEALVQELRSGKKMQGPWAICIAPQPPRAQVPVEVHDAGTAPKTGGAMPASTSGQSGVAATSSPIKIDVTLVTVPVVVTDSSGRYVGNLQESDFRVFENDVEQKIDRLIFTSEPFDVALVVDSSWSVRTDFAEIKEAAAAFIEALRPEDRVMIVSFNNRVWLDCEWSSNHKQLLQALLPMRAENDSRLYDALDLTIAERLQWDLGRKAIVLLTDGMDVGSGLAGPEDALAQNAASNVPVYAIQYDTRQANTHKLPANVKVRLVPEGAFNKDPAFHQGAQFLQTLSETSGGRFESAENITSVNDVFSRIAGELRSQYTLCYYPANQARDGSLRRIRVEVKGTDLNVRARTSYRAGVQPVGGK